MRVKKKEKKEREENARRTRGEAEDDDDGGGEEGGGKSGSSQYIVHDCCDVHVTISNHAYGSTTSVAEVAMSAFTFLAHSIVVWPLHSESPWKQYIQLVSFTGPSPTGPPTNDCTKSTSFLNNQGKAGEKKKEWLGSLAF